MDQGTLLGRILKTIFLSVFTLATLYPVLWVFKMALSPSQGFDASVNPLPSQPTLENFRHVLFERPFFVSLAHVEHRIEAGEAAVVRVRHIIAAMTLGKTHEHPHLVLAAIGSPVPQIVEMVPVHGQ